MDNKSAKREKQRETPKRINMKNYNSKKLSWIKKQNYILKEDTLSSIDLDWPRYIPVKLLYFKE